MFSKEPRYLLRKNQLAEVVCQLRFPEILIIGTEPPAGFQEMIRDAFPQYSVRKEYPAPKLSGVPGNFTVEKSNPVINHQFVSADGVWKVNLTSTFISLACSRYTCWEDFAHRLDKPLAAFIQCYKPAYFQRIGMRYLNFVSRKALDLEDMAYRELFESPYLGLLAEEDVLEQSANRSTVDAEIAIRGGCRVKLHAGPGLVSKKGSSQQDVRFIFDQDLYMPGNVPVNLSAGALQTLHSQAWSIFRGAITDTLFDAMEPESIE